MKTRLKRLWGFRSGVPWKRCVAVLYDGMCVCFLGIAMTTPPLIPAGLWDAAIVKLSSLVLFLWMLSPAIFLSDTPMRAKLPFLRDGKGMRSLVGMMILGVLFLSLFMATEGMHTPSYQKAFRQHISASFETFVQAGTEPVIQNMPTGIEEISQ